MVWPGVDVVCSRGDYGGIFILPDGSVRSAATSLWDDAIACEVVGVGLLDGGSVEAADGDP